jgi:hypothetical protein
MLSLGNAPRFAQFTDHGDGTGLLTLNPGPDDVGASSVTLFANDNGTPPVGSAQKIQVIVTRLPNQTPVANAGTNRTVRLGSLVTLDGTGSYDPDNGPAALSYAWTQTGGPAVMLSGANTAQPTFTPTVPGSYTFSLVVSDGQASSATAYVTITAMYNFTGFFQPVDNLPTLNSVKAGSAVPVKFSLSGNQGFDIFGNTPASQQIVCDTSAPVDTIETTVASGSSSLSYDAATDQYTYAWKTDRAWAGTCRQLTVQLKDGSAHLANFRFTK